MRKNNEMFYIKKDLLSFKDPELFLNLHEIDMDYMALKQWKYSDIRNRQLNTV
jgi:hypothetical protein